MKCQWLSGAKFAILTLGLSIAPTPSAIAQQHTRATVEGSWTGDFGAGQWTFKFVRTNGAWSGSYTYPKYKGVNPVLNISASDTTARFSLNAKTYIKFDLKLDSSRNNLGGTVKFEHGVTSDTPPVVVPVTFKRIA